VEKRAKIFPPDEVFLRLMIERNPRALDRVSLVLELPGKCRRRKNLFPAAARQRERADDGEGYYSAELHRGTGSAAERIERGDRGIM
jgi:hypothetical protein